MMERTALTQVAHGIFFCLLIAVISSMGCNRTSIRDLPFLRSTQKDSISFDSNSGSNSVKLTLWHESFEAALQASAETGKPILADFTGSDWCSWCIKLKEDVFETPEFKEWARENVILLELDYPKRSMQSAAIRKQNSELKKRYGITGYPTVLLLDSEGEVLGKLGYDKSPTTWISTAAAHLSDSNRKFR